MTMIAIVGRKSLKNRILITMIYCALIILGATMIVPFMITISGSASNDFDYERFLPLPRFLWSTRDRFVKCLVPYFNEYRDWNLQLKAYCPEAAPQWSTWSLIGRDIKTIDKIADKYLDDFTSCSEQQKLIAADYAEFSERYPLSDKVVYAAQNDTIRFLTNNYEDKVRESDPDAAAMSSSQLRNAALKLLGAEWSLPFESFYDISFETEMKYPMDFQGWFPPMHDPKYLSYNKFKKAVNAHYFTPGIKKKWLDFLKQKNYSFNSANEVFPVIDQTTPELQTLWLEFKKSCAPATPAVPYALRSAWYKFLSSEEVAQVINLPAKRNFTINSYNRLAGTNYARLSDTPFPLPASFKPAMQQIWLKFMLERYPLRLIEIKSVASQQAKYQDFVKNTLKKISIANNLLGTQCKKWSDFKLCSKPAAGFDESRCNQRDLWKNFVKKLPVKEKIYSSSEIAYQKFLLKKYGSIQNVNEKYGWHLAHIEEAFPPFMIAYTTTFINNEYVLSFFPLLDNYKVVVDFLLFNGNAIFVTAILILLTIAFTLTVNPLAAYALSRFNIRGQDKILLFLLATMAFPAMVSAIPAYLLMRDIGLLNTFLALVIPGAANGMSIFILKGFFDSLPMELFEAATIDGASEMQIFRIVAMPLVKPILAINCLTAFIVAYNGWQWALIICQDKSMWTIAVWLYQASSWWGHSPWIVSAGFVIASVPTLILFLSCQKIILRGIIIPSMK
jgi:ABC-type glycerol-3-phosphate transport system permease component